MESILGQDRYSGISGGFTALDYIGCRSYPCCKASSDEAKIVKLINQQRSKKNLKPLRLEGKLTNAAVAQSKVMAAKGVLSHGVAGPLDKRVRKAGYRYTFVAENIAQLSANQKGKAELVTKMWMNSPGHKKNILSARSRQIGIAIVRDKYGNYYYTTIFGAK